MSSQELAKTLSTALIAVLKNRNFISNPQSLRQQIYNFTSKISSLFNVLENSNELDFSRIESPQELAILVNNICNALGPNLCEFFLNRNPSAKRITSNGNAVPDGIQIVYSLRCFLEHNNLEEITKIFGLNTESIIYKLCQILADSNIRIRPRSFPVDAEPTIVIDSGRGYKFGIYDEGSGKPFITNLESLQNNLKNPKVSCQRCYEIINNLLNQVSKCCFNAVNHLRNTDAQMPFTMWDTKYDTQNNCSMYVHISSNIDEFVNFYSKYIYKRQEYSKQAFLELVDIFVPQLRNLAQEKANAEENQMYKTR